MPNFMNIGADKTSRRTARWPLRHTVLRIMQTKYSQKRNISARLVKCIRRRAEWVDDDYFGLRST